MTAAVTAITRDPAQASQVRNYRIKLRKDLSEGKYETFAEALLVLFSRAIAFSTFGRIKLRANGTAIALLLYLIISTWSTAFVFEIGASGREQRVLMSVHIWGAVVAVLQLRLACFFSRLLMSTLLEAVLGKLDRLEDLKDLAGWLKSSFSKKRQLWFCAAVAAVLTPLSLYAVLADRGAGQDSLNVLLNPGTASLCVIAWFIGATGWYFFIPAISLCSRLSRYRISLFDFEPSSSGFVISICNMMHTALFFSTISATIFTTGVFLVALHDPNQQIAFSATCAWAPIVVVTGYYQYALYCLIRRAKTRVLQQLQAGIGKLQDGLDSLDAAGIDKLNKLLDLNRRVFTTNNTALDWRGALATINTLLLPLASFLIKNYLEK